MSDVSCWRSSERKLPQISSSFLSILVNSSTVMLWRLFQQVNYNGTNLILMFIKEISHLEWSPGILLFFFQVFSFMFIFTLLRCVRIPFHRSAQDDPFLDSVVVDLDFSLKIFYAFWFLRLLLVCGQEIYFPG